MPKKSQIWFTDFVIALFIFTLILITYYTYTANISKTDVNVVDSLLSDSQAITSALLLGGFPDNWDNDTVIQIGLTNNNQKINSSKLARLKDINYSDAKSILGTVYDFFLFFENSDGDLINIATECGYGKPDVNVNKTFKLGAYYQQGAGNELEDEIVALEEKLGISIYREWSSANDMLNNISAYDFVLMENPKFSPSQVSDLESYVSSGGFKANPVKVFLSNEILNPSSGQVLGTDYHKRVGGQCTGETATVLNEDLFLSLIQGETIIPNDCSYVEGDINNLAEFADGKTAIGKWEYGNGTVYYFSDFDVNYVGDLQGGVQDALESSILVCGSSDAISLDNLEYKNFVRTERFLIFDSKPAKMVLYLWR